MSGPLLPALHLDVLYERDDRGRLLRVRSTSVPTPLAHLFRTATGNHWLINAGLPEATAARLDAVFADEPVRAPEDPQHWERSVPRCLEAVRSLLTPFRLSGAGSEYREYRGPAYSFPEGLGVTGSAEAYVPDGDTAAVAADLAWIATASEEERPIVAARDEAGRVVSICHAARATAEAVEAGLDTTPAARRQGHALAVTSRWAVEVRASGRVPLYSTSWENEASRGVARRLGLVLYGEDWHLG